jgi:hypothetical protein
MIVICLDLASQEEKRITGNKKRSKKEETLVKSEKICRDNIVDV